MANEIERRCAADMQHMVALVAFAGDLNPDVAVAAEELRRAGYEVIRLPDEDEYAASEDNHQLAFLEVHKCFEASNNVDEIVGQGLRRSGRGRQQIRRGLLDVIGPPFAGSDRCL